MGSDRLDRLPGREPPGLRIAEACSRRARLLGLAFMREVPAREALLIPRCRSVHTLGMRFAIDVVFLDAEVYVIEVRHHVPPWRLVRNREASALLETRAGESWRFIKYGRLQA